MQEYFVYFKFFKRKDRDKRFGEGRRRSRQGFFYSRRDGSTPLQVAMRIGIPIESGWYRVIYAPGCAFAPPGAFFGLERRDGRPYPPVPAAANVGADAERSCSRRRSVTDAACPLRVLIGPPPTVHHRTSCRGGRPCPPASSIFCRTSLMFVGADALIGPSPPQRMAPLYQEGGQIAVSNQGGRF